MNAHNPSLNGLSPAARKADPDRFLCAMFAPPEARETLFALICFNHEIARVRESVTEPAAGLIRLQWWREALAEAAEGRSRRHEVLSPLAEAMQRHQLPLALFIDLINARERDLDDAPLATMADFITYTETTSAPLLDLWNLAIGKPGGDTRKIGGAYAMVGTLRAVPYQQQSKRLMLPDDLLIRHGMFRSEVQADRQRELMPRAALDIAKEAASRVEGVKGTWPALTRLYLRQLRKTGYDVYDARHKDPHPLSAAVLLWDRMMTK